MLQYRPCPLRLVDYIIDSLHICGHGAIAQIILDLIFTFLSSYEAYPNPIKHTLHHLFPNKEQTIHKITILLCS